MLRADSSVPLYKQLYHQLRVKIEQGGFEIGAKLPSERELAACHGISRITARRAVDILRDEGYIRIFQGKGSYVAHARQHAPSNRWLQGFTELMLEQGAAPTSRLLSRGLVAATSDVAHHLGIRTTDQAIRIRRLRFANDHPIAIHTAYLPYPLCSPLLEIDLEKHSLYRALEEALGIRLVHANQSLQTVLGADADLPLLGVNPPAAVLQLERGTYDVEGHPVEYLHAIYRDDAHPEALVPYAESN
jgi:GntR family transcriptional regulator